MRNWPTLPRVRVFRATEEIWLGFCSYALGPCPRDGRAWQFPFSIWNSVIDESDFSIDAETLDKVLQREKEALGYPSLDNRFRNDVYGDDDDDMCRYCDKKDCPDRRANYTPDDLDEDDYYDDAKYDDDRPFDLTPEMRQEVFPFFLEMLFKRGRGKGRTSEF